MRKSIYTLMVSTLIAAASMTACSSQPSETTTAETTAAESTQENGTSAESSDASETTTAGEKETAQTTDADHAEDETLSEKEITELYRGLAELLVYPSYIGIDDGIVVNNRTEFMALDADKVFTDALIEAVKTADVSSTELTKAGFIVGDPSGKPAVTFGLDKEGSIGITAINY